MAVETQKIQLPTEQFAAYAKDSMCKLKNIIVEFMPANRTSIMQGMDQWTMTSLKHKYHRHLVIL
jgi:hypothetical protein